MRPPPAVSSILNRSLQATIGRHTSWSSATIISTIAITAANLRPARCRPPGPRSCTSPGRAACTGRSSRLVAMKNHPPAMLIIEFQTSPIMLAGTSSRRNTCQPRAPGWPSPHAAAAGCRGHDGEEAERHVRHLAGEDRDHAASSSPTWRVGNRWTNTSTSPGRNVSTGSDWNTSKAGHHHPLGPVVVSGDDAVQERERQRQQVGGDPAEQSEGGVLRQRPQRQADGENLTGIGPPWPALATSANQPPITAATPGQHEHLDPNRRRGGEDPASPLSVWKRTRDMETEGETRRNAGRMSSRSGSKRLPTASGSLFGY